MTPILKGKYNLKKSFNDHIKDGDIIYICPEMI